MNPQKPVVVTASFRGSKAMASCTATGGGLLQASFPAERRARPCERLIGCAGGIDPLPVEGPEIVVFLLLDHRRVSIAGIALARRGPGAPGGEIGSEEQAVEAHAQGLRG